MQKIIIPLSGITRNTDDGLCKDGESMELINARVKDGSIEPVSKPIVVASFEDDYKKVYYHPKADKYIAIKNDGSLVQMDSDYSNVNVLSTSLQNVISVEFIGNVACALTSSGIKYMVWKDNNYYYLGDLPELPEINITTNEFYETTEGNASFNIKNNARYNNDDGKFTDWVNSYYGYLQKCLSSLNKKGYFVDNTCIRIAFRLYDGSYVKHSPVRLLTIDSGAHPSSFDSKGRYGYTARNDDTWDIQEFTFYLLGIKPKFSFNDFDITEWKDLILSIDIFATSSKRDHWNIIYGRFSDTITDPDKSTKGYCYKDIENESQFYKIASISLDGKIDYYDDEGDVSADSIALSDNLVDDYNTHNNIIARKSYVYNNRLHIFDITTDFFKGYSKDYLYDYCLSTLGTGNIDVYTYLNTTQGETILLKSFQNVSIPNKISPYIMYPDSRATKVVIVLSYDSSIKYKEIALKPHKTLNAAIAELTSSLSPLEVSSWDDYTGTIAEDTISETDKNVLKVSSLNDPFYFPPETTYQFQTNIEAIQSNTTALSQGQFGQHPLYVFCHDGVYAMSVGNGGVVYANQVPVTRDVIVSDEVCGMDNFVCFLSEKGLMAINGSQTELLSESITGFLPSCVLSSPIIPMILAIAGMDSKICSVTFTEYIENAVIGYNYKDSEIIIANGSYLYSYVFNLKSKQWHIIDMQIDGFTNTYPEQYAIVHKDDGTILYNLNNDHRSVSTMALISRPIKLGTNTYKRILQTALRGIVKRSLSDLYLRGEAVQFRGEDLTIFSNVGFYILGSNDAEHFELVSGKESIVDIRDLVTKMNKSKAYKYFMACLVGGVRSDVAINYIEMLVDETYQNRLR